MTSERYAAIKAMDDATRQKLLQLNPDLNNGPGIYVWTRDDEDGIPYAYIGKSKHILARQVQHLFGRAQDIDMGLAQHGLYDADTNPYGYRIGVIPCTEADLDGRERYYTLLYARKGYQSLSRTTGGSKGKRLLGDKRAANDYAKGLAAGRREMAREIAEIVESLRTDGDAALLRRLQELLSEGDR